MGGKGNAAGVQVLIFGVPVWHFRFAFLGVGFEEFPGLEHPYPCCAKQGDVPYGLVKSQSQS